MQPSAPVKQQSCDGFVLTLYRPINRRFPMIVFLIRVCTIFKKHSHDGFATVILFCVVQRRIATDGLGVRVCAILEQQFRRGNTAPASRIVQRRFSASVPNVRIYPCSSSLLAKASRPQKAAKCSGAPNSSLIV